MTHKIIQSFTIALFVLSRKTAEIRGNGHKICIVPCGQLTIV